MLKPITIRPHVHPRLLLIGAARLSAEKYAAHCEAIHAALLARKVVVLPVAQTKRAA